MELEDDDEGEKKTPKATIIRRVLVFALALACAGGWIYTRYLVKKGGLGEACRYDMHCEKSAPRCLKQDIDSDGVCSRSCDTDGDCAEGIKCVKVELDDRDERGRPLEGGYCFPQSILDARKKKKNGDASAPAPSKSDSWVDVPEIAGQLEGEITFGAKAYLVKGTLLQTKAKTHRIVVDTSSLRVYSVDDDKKTFGASQIAVGPGEANVTKTDRTDTVADKPCTIWQLDDGKVKDVCALAGGAFVDPTARSITPWEKQLASRGAFLVRSEKLTATKIDLHPVDAAGFAIPKTYRNLAAK